MDIYDVATGTFSRANFSMSRANLASASIGDRYALFAGGAFGAAMQDAVDVYDAVEGLWFPARPLSVPRMYLMGAGSDDVAMFAGTHVAPPGQSPCGACVFVRFLRHCSCARKSTGGLPWLAGGTSAKGITNTIDVYTVAELDKDKARFLRGETQFEAV